MIRNLYSVFDAKSELFAVPLNMMNDSVAIRTFTAMANDPESFISVNPEDYTLFFVGTFDEESGKLDCPATPRSLGLALQYKRDLNQKEPV